MSRYLSFVLCMASAIASMPIVSNSARAASIYSTTASLVEITPPSSVVQGALEDNDHAVVFVERQNFLLTSDLFVDATNAGASIESDGDGGVAGSIPAGTQVDSFLIHYDSVGEPTIAEGVHWLITFVNTDLIVGLIYSDGLLDASDYLGAPATTYPTGETFRGTTGSSEGIDSLLWSQYFAMSGTQTVTVEVDQLRIILLVPEPASGLLLATALLAACVRRRSCRTTQLVSA